MASLGGGGGGGSRPGCHHFGLTPRLWCETSLVRTHNFTDLEWIPYFFHFVWSSPSSIGLKIHWFLGEDLLRFFFCFWYSHTFGLKTHLFCSEDLFFLVFTYFWYEKGCHHEIPLRVPPFLATPLAVPQLFVSHSGLQAGAPRAERGPVASSDSNGFFARK